MKKTCTLLLFAGLCLPLLAAKKNTAASDAEIQKLQASWDETRSYQSEFVQTVKSVGSGLDEEPITGTLSVVKPNCLKWEDRTSKRTQLLNGKEYWDIAENPRRKSRVITYRPDISRTLSKTSMAILVGNGKFKDFYHVTLLPGTAEEAVLELRPKTDSNETLIAKMDKNSYVLRSLTTKSPDSEIRLEFKNTQRNPALKKSFFSFERKENDVVQTRED